MIKTIIPIALITMFGAGCVTPQSKMPTVDSTSSMLEAQKQRELVVEDIVNNNRRLQAVASRVVTSGVSMCGDKVAPYYGLHAWTNDKLKNEWKDAAKSRYGLTQQVQISSVAAGSPADLAGIRELDIIQSIEGNEVVLGKDSITTLSKKLRELGASGNPVKFSVKRGLEQKDILVTPTKACDFAVNLTDDGEKNAFADGKQIYVTKAMMEFFKTDEEIALVLSHELAHNSMKHIDAKKTNAIVGGVLGFVLDIAAAAGGVNTNGDFSRMGSGLAAGAHSVEFEQEADYVGLYFMALSGYKIDDAPNFWRRMAQSNSSSITLKSSHPTAPERFVALESTVAEIKRKQQDNLPLKPEMKTSADLPKAQPMKTGLQ